MRAVAPVILFDGMCNLCTHGVRWIIRRDRRAVFRFAPIQSDIGQRLLRESGLEPKPGSMVLIDDRGAHIRSDAALRIAARLGLPWSIARAAAILPRSVLDTLYTWIARNRYRWFGKRDSCMVPTADVQSRFLDGKGPEN